MLSKLVLFKLVLFCIITRYSFIWLCVYIMHLCICFSIYLFIYLSFYFISFIFFLPDSPFIELTVFTRCLYYSFFFFFSFFNFCFISSNNNFTFLIFCIFLIYLFIVHYSYPLSGKVSSNLHPLINFVFYLITHLLIYSLFPSIVFISSST